MMKRHTRWWLLSIASVLSLALPGLSLTAGAVGRPPESDRNRAQVTTLDQPFAADARRSRGIRCASVTAEACNAASRLGRGINFGNMLEAPLEAGYGLWLQYDWIKAAKDAGFEHIRLPVRWSNHAASTADATLDAEFLKRVDGILAESARIGMPVVLDMHHYRQLDGDPVESNEVRVEDSVVETRAARIWNQLAKHYRNRFPLVYFELYNEPHGALNTAHWNELFPRMLSAVRSEDPVRPVIIGPADWNSPDALTQLKLPADRNVIVTAHVYTPHPFTHQGAWGGQWKSLRECCDRSQLLEIQASFDRIIQWSETHGVPVYIGEWGVHVSAPARSRVMYVKAFQAELERTGLPSAYWQLSSDFGIYDVKTGSWNKDMLDGIMNPFASKAEHR